MTPVALIADRGMGGSELERVPPDHRRLVPQADDGDPCGRLEPIPR